MKPDRSAILDALQNAPYVDDAGFTDGVIRALPPPRRASRARFVLVPSFATIGCVGAWMLTHGSAGVVAAAAHVDPSSDAGTAALMAVAAIAALLVAGALAAARGFV